MDVFSFFNSFWYNIPKRRGSFNGSQKKEIGGSWQKPTSCQTILNWLNCKL